MWIDALCIDQRNVEERNQQVRQKDQIYSRAAGVLVWLGPQGNNSDLAMDFISVAGGEDGLLDTFIGIISLASPRQIQALQDSFNRGY